ncbi:MAG: hypothetical protein ABIV21_00265 [Pyrinomonadaceae bacterium]
MKGLFLILGITIACCSLAFGQRIAKPPQPFIDRGACPFECCTYRDWDVTAPTAVRKDMNDRSPIAFRLRKGERVVGVTGVVVTTSPGIATVLRSEKLGKVDLKRGDTVYLLTYLGEGFNKIWHKGRIVEAETYDESKLRVNRQPKAVWWVKVKNRRGQIGWSRQPDHFGNKDQCGN